MLILRRKSGESILISDNITLTVLDINEGSVRLAIDAPKAIPILRSELLQAADANRDSAATEQNPFQLLERAHSAPPRPVRPGAARHAPKVPDAPASPSTTPDAPAPTSTTPDAPAPTSTTPDAPAPSKVPDAQPTP